MLEQGVPDQGALNRSRNINNLSGHALLAGEHKISAADFTPTSVAAMAARFAGSLGYPSRPTVTGIGGGMIQVSSAEL